MNKLSDEWKMRRASIALLRAKREVKNDNLELVKQLNTVQRLLEQSTGVYAVAMMDEYSVGYDYEPRGTIHA